MTDLIKAIASLCMLYSPAPDVESRQIKCHAYYAKCFRNKFGLDKTFYDCVIERSNYEVSK